MQQQQAVQIEPAGYPFTPQEPARLGIYKAAVEAGFYTDFFQQGGDSEARTHRMS